MPACANREVHINKGFKRDIDISFCAHLNSEREKLLTDLKSHGIDVYNENKYGADLVDIYNRSKMVLNIPQGKTGISQRVFEAGACGALVMNKIIDKANALFLNDRHCGGMEWTDIDNLLFNINYVKGFSNQTIQSNFFCSNIHKNHTAKNRLETILRDVIEF